MCSNNLRGIQLAKTITKTIGKGTTFKVAQEVLFLKEMEKLLLYVIMGYNVLQDVTKTIRPKN